MGHTSRQDHMEKCGVQKYNQMMTRWAQLVYNNKKNSNRIDWETAAGTWNTESQGQHIHPAQMRAKYNQYRDAERRRSRKGQGTAMAPDTSARRASTQGLTSNAALPTGETMHLPVVAIAMASPTSETMHPPVVAIAVDSPTGTWALPSEIGLTPTTHDMIDADTPDMSRQINDAIGGLDFYRPPLRMPILDDWD